MGYAPSYVPFCGLAVIEELARERTPVEDPLPPWYSRISGQAVELHQTAVIEGGSPRRDHACRVRDRDRRRRPA